MSPATRRGLAVALAALAAWVCTGASAGAAPIAWAPCKDSNDFACGHLTVPLDPTGTTPGTLTLAVRRHRAPLGEARSAIVALAGGPGQPALPLTEQFAELLGPATATRDLIVFDPRGAGLSHALSCRAFKRPPRGSSITRLLASCAAQLGPTRSFYTSAQAVADVEAIRQAAGYEKLVLYGTSYGTKVAELYAQAHPDHVEALVLDSVVTPNGPDPLDRSTFAAIPRVLGQLCAARGCAGITRDPAADLARVLARSRRGTLRGRAVDGAGGTHLVAVTAAGLLATLFAGDFNPLLRGELLTSVRAAALGDRAPIARLLATVARGGAEGGEEFSAALYFATICEEEQFPWSRSSSPAQRLGEARLAAAALPASVFAPFTAVDAVAFEDIPACAGWPFAAAAPPPQDGAPLPRVPALVLSGAADLRTPTADARTVAALIPGSHLLVVPYAGHSVLGEEPTSCGRDALEALLAGRPVRQCRHTRPPAGSRPPPLPPRRLGLVSPLRGYAGRVGRTLDALALSLGDLARQLVLAIGDAEGLAALGNLRTGGLRAGWARFADGNITLRGYSYVPGMVVSGTITSGSADLRIGGAAAAHGSMRLGAHGALTGTLEGRPATLAASSVASAAIVGPDATATFDLRPGSRARRRFIGELDGVLAGILGP